MMVPIFGDYAFLMYLLLFSLTIYIKSYFFRSFAFLYHIIDKTELAKAMIQNIIKRIFDIELLIKSMIGFNLSNIQKVMNIADSTITRCGRMEAIILPILNLFFFVF